ncbi:MAG TPA: phenylalanine--tRNA ligase subunit beta [Thermoanaerobaculia bacterium]|nr:phenylalanine--tRNA ligase subunit beta [Thermoanaerobaculia bacterium]
MLFSLEWLSEYVEIPGGEDGARELARRLTGAGLAVEQLARRDGDLLFDVDVTTNRVDCMCHVGLAREVAVVLDEPLRRPPAAAEESPEPIAELAALAVEDPEGCPRYVARVVRGVTVGPSPEWLRRRLEAIGQRSINNVVDVTNYVLWELGQPLHAFDLARLAGSRLVVRRAAPGEKLVTLDGAPRELDAEILVIADAERPVALAGMMGGADSEVTAATADVLLESAHFDRRRVRAAGRRFGLHTDASHRFERGTDPEGCPEAASRAALLLAEVAGGVVAHGALDLRWAEAPSWTPRGFLDLGRLQAFAGAEVPRSDVKRWLNGLGFRLRALDDAVWEVTAPSWRYFDMEPRPAEEGKEPKIYPADLYEEVLRLYGYDRIPANLPAVAGPDAPAGPEAARRRRLRDQLAACGYAEAINLAFVDPREDESFPSLRPSAPALQLANPLSERLALLRRSLLPGLVESARFNQRRGAPFVQLFEVGRVFFPPSGNRAEAALPDEPEMVALVCGGRRGTPWDGARDLDLFDLKGVLEELAESFGGRFEARAADLPGLVRGAAAELVLRGEVVGSFGQVAGEEGYALYAAELAVEPLVAGEPALAVAAPSRLPGVAADYTLTHPVGVSWAELERAIARAAPPDLASFRLKDRYRGPGVPEGAVNTTITFLYNARDRSLTQEEVNERQAALTAELERRFGWRG